MIPGTSACQKHSGELKRSRLCVDRFKNALSVKQPIAGERRAIERYLATPGIQSPVAVPIRAKITRQAINYVVRLADKKAKLGIVWFHMLRHSCGYCLADQGTI